MLYISVLHVFFQQIQEQKKQKLLEKEAKDKERLKKAAELRKRRVEEQKRFVFFHINKIVVCSKPYWADP